MSSSKQVIAEEGAVLRRGALRKKARSIFLISGSCIYILVQWKSNAAAAHAIWVGFAVIF